MAVREKKTAKWGRGVLWGWGRWERDRKDWVWRGVEGVASTAKCLQCGIRLHRSNGKKL